MDAKIIIEIVDKLIGEIEPRGETHIDTKRLENIKKYAKVAEHMVFELNQISYNSEAQEHSIKQIGKVADGFIKNLPQKS